MVTVYIPVKLRYWNIKTRWACVPSCNLNTVFNTDIDNQKQILKYAKQSSLSFFEFNDWKRSRLSFTQRGSGNNVDVSGSKRGHALTPSSCLSIYTGRCLLIHCMIFQKICHQRHNFIFVIRHLLSDVLFFSVAWSSASQTASPETSSADRQTLGCTIISVISTEMNPPSPSRRF